MPSGIRHRPGGIFGQNTRIQRKRLGMTQEELAESAEISHKHLSEIELGYQVPSLTVATAISRALNVPLDSLIGGPSRAEPAKSATLLKIIRLLERISKGNQHRVYRALWELFRR